MRIVLEGISGSGKTSQALQLKRQLKRSAVVEIVGEFSRNAIGRAARRCYQMNRERFVRFHASEAYADQTHLVMLADAVSKAEEVSTSTADVVLIDRLFDSWLCYSLAGKKRRVLSSADVLEELYRRSREEYLSDSQTVFLEVDVATALERLASRDDFGLKEGSERQLQELAWFFSELYTRVPVHRVAAGRPFAEVTTAIAEAVGLKSMIS